MITLLSYNYTEQVATIMFDGKRVYQYNVPEYWYRKLAAWLRHKNLGRAAKFLGGMRGNKRR